MMSSKRHSLILSQRGSAIAMVLVALLIIGVTAGTIASWAEHIGREQKAMELISSKSLLDQSVNNAAFDDQVCHKIIQRDCTAPCAPASVGATLPLTISLGSIGEMKSGLDSPAMGVRFTNVSLEGVTNPSGITWRGTLVLEIEARAGTRAFGGNKFPALRIPGFSVDMPGPGFQITRCLADSPDVICTKHGGEIDDQNYNPPRCVLPTNYGGVTCAANQVHQKDAMGNITCVAASSVIAQGSCPPDRFLYSFGYGAHACLTLSEAIGRRCGPNQVLRSNGDGSAACISLPQIVGEVCPPNHALASDGGSGAKCVPFSAPAVNGVGSWGPCVMGSQTYTITTPSSGGGTACPATNGQVQACSGPTCPAATKSWTVAGQTCSATFPLTNEGTNSPLITNTVSGKTGSASYACLAGGNWALDSSPQPGATCAASNTYEPLVDYCQMSANGKLCSPSNSWLSTPDDCFCGPTRPSGAMVPFGFHSQHRQRCNALGQVEMVDTVSSGVCP